MENDTPTITAKERHRATQKSTWVSVFANIVLTCGQLVAGIFAGSWALVADAMHALSDLVADGVVLVAVRHSSAPPDSHHHYGHQRYENIASLLLGLLLLAVGLGMVWSAAGKVIHHSSLTTVHQSALWVALGALLVKELLFRYMLAVARKVGSSLLVANAWHARSDAASSLVVAIGIMGNLAGLSWLDPLAALVVGLMITRTGWKFVFDAVQDLCDRALPPEVTERLSAEIAATPGVRGVHDVKTRKAGDMIIVDVHLEVDGNLSVRHGHDIAKAARARVMAKFPVLDLMTHIDPI